MDECETMVDGCDEKAICTNTEGSYDCTCCIGYSGNGTFCEGIYISIQSFACDELNEIVLLRNFSLIVTKR